MDSHYLLESQPNLGPGIIRASYQARLHIPLKTLDDPLPLSLVRKLKYPHERVKKLVPAKSPVARQHL